MKRLFSLVASLAIAAISLVSCQEKIEAPVTSGKHSVHFTVDLTSATKTVLEGNTVNWTAADASRFHVFENGVEATSDNLVFDFTDGLATVTAIFDDTDATEFTYTAYVSSLNTNNKPVILNNQTPTATSFDPAADILFAKPIVTSDQNESLELMFQFARPISINKMTIKGILEGETIQKVTLEGNKSLGGSFDPSQDFKYSADDRLITINATTNVVYFVTAEASEVLPTITVTTDKAVYSKTFSKAISFVANQLHSFSVSFSEGDRKTADAEYGLVTSLKDLAEGDVIVLGCSTQNTAAGLLAGNKYFSSQDATIKDGILKCATVAEITLNKDGENWTLTTKEGKIGATAAKSLAVDKGVDTWTISFAEGSAVIASTNSSYGSIMYNASSPRFLNYASGQTAIEIYKKGFTPSESTDPDQGETETPTSFNSLEELVNANIESGTTVTVSFENVPIKSIFTTAQGYRNGVLFDIQKAGKDIEIYYQNVPEEWVIGGTLSGTMTCPWKLYSGTWELAPEKDTWAWTNLTYAAPSVARTEATLSYTSKSSLRIDDEPDTYEVTYNGDGVLSVNSSDPDVATISISDNTVTVTPKKDGKTTITISAPQTDKYTSVSKTYTLTVIGKASLNFSFNGGKADIANTPGMTQSGLGSDYASAPKLKFDSTGDYVIIEYNESASTLKYTIKGNGFSEGKFDVLESIDGLTYTIVKSHTDLPTTSNETLGFKSESRFVKFLYANKSAGNVALGNISIEK